MAWAGLRKRENFALTARGPPENQTNQPASRLGPAALIALFTNDLAPLGAWAVLDQTESMRFIQVFRRLKPGKGPEMNAAVSAGVREGQRRRKQLPAYALPARRIGGDEPP